MSIPIWTANGCTQGAITDLIPRLAPLNPVWLWLEPRPGSGLHPDGTPIAEISPAELHPLLRPADPLPSLDSRLVLDETRLFWPTASLHLLADSDSTRWSIWAVQAGLPQAFRATIEALGLVNEGALDLEDGGVETVLTRRDFERFGLPAPGPRLPDRMQIKTYRTGGAIAAWTILTQEGR